MVLPAPTLAQMRAHLRRKSAAQRTMPSTIIKWNFDKIFTGVDGKPYNGETVFHGGDTDAAVKAVVGKLLAAGSMNLMASGYAGNVAGPATFFLLAGLLASAALFAVSASKPQEESGDLPAGDHYIRIA